MLADAARGSVPGFAAFDLRCARRTREIRPGRRNGLFSTEQRNRTIPSRSHIPILQSRLLHFPFRYDISVWHPLFWDATRRRACGDLFSAVSLGWWKFKGGVIS